MALPPFQVHSVLETRWLPAVFWGTGAASPSAEGPRRALSGALLGPAFTHAPTSAEKHLSRACGPC